MFIWSWLGIGVPRREIVHIMQGAREIGEKCPMFAIKWKKYLEAAFGAIRESQLTIAAPAREAVWVDFKVCPVSDNNQQGHQQPAGVIQRL